MTIKNGDMPASPVLEENNISGGLTKREHFAAMAMQGLLSAESASDIHNGIADYLASAAVIIADELLKELAK